MQQVLAVMRESLDEGKAHAVTHGLCRRYASISVFFVAPQTSRRALYCITLYYTILYYTILYYTILYYTILYYTRLDYAILYYTILYCTRLYYTILYYTILYFAIITCTSWLAWQRYEKSPSASPAGLVTWGQAGLPHNTQAGQPRMLHT